MAKFFKKTGFTLHLLKRRKRRILPVYLKKGDGFTLIELLTVTLIIAILTAITFPNYQSARRQLALNRAASKLVQDLRRTQEMAMAVAECCDGITPSGGYGIYFNILTEAAYDPYDDGYGAPDENFEYKLYADTYKLYADTGEDGVYTSGDKILETFNFEGRVYIADLSVEGVGLNDGVKYVSVNFKPPDPEVKIGRYRLGTLYEEDELTITLCVEGADCAVVKKVITINRAGLVYVE